MKRTKRWYLLGGGDVVDWLARLVYKRTVVLTLAQSSRSELQLCSLVRATTCWGAIASPDEEKADADDVALAYPGCYRESRSVRSQLGGGVMLPRGLLRRVQ